MNCPDLETWLAHCEAVEPAPELERHLGTCPACAGRRARAARLVDLLGEAALEPVPPALERRAAAIPGRQRLRRLLSWVALPAPAPGPALAVRGGGAAHLLLRAGPYDIDLAWLDGGTLLGQVLPHDDDGELLPAGTCSWIGAGPPRIAPLEEDGSFRFQDAVGEGTLLIEAGEARIVVEEPRGPGG